MIIIGLDPGTEKSALVAFDGRSVLQAAELPNDEMLAWLDVGSGCDCHADRTFSKEADAFHSFVALETGDRPLIIEKFESYGMAVGREVFDTIFWAGRFAEIFPWQHFQVPRRDIKQHICHTARATDANIRQALIDRFGGQEKAIGKKAAPGPLYGLKGHLWAAFAVAITWHDQNVLRIVEQGAAPASEQPF